MAWYDIKVNNSNSPAGLLTAEEWNAHVADHFDLRNLITNSGFVSGQNLTNGFITYVHQGVLRNSIIYQSGANIGINTTNPSQTLTVNGSFRLVPINYTPVPEKGTIFYSSTQDDFFFYLSNNWVSLKSIMNTQIQGSGLANRLAYFLNSNTLSATSLFTDSVNLGIGAFDSAYRLYVDGQTYLNGSLTFPKGINVNFISNNTSSEWSFRFTNYSNPSFFRIYAKDNALMIFDLSNNYVIVPFQSSYSLATNNLRINLSGAGLGTIPIFQTDGWIGYASIVDPISIAQISGDYYLGLRASSNFVLTSDGRLDLSNTGVTPGTFGGQSGSDIKIPVITVDSKGRLTSVSEQTVTIGGGIGNIFGFGTAKQFAYFTGTTTITSTSKLVLRDDGNLGIDVPTTYSRGTLALKGTFVLVSPDQSIVPQEGMIYYDGLTKKFKFSDGTNWYDFPITLPSNLISGSGTSNYIAKFTGSNSIGNSIIQDNGTNVGVGGAPVSGRTLSIYGDLGFSGSATYFNIYTPTNSGIAFSPGGTQQITITSDGRLQIKGTHTTATLYVNGTIFQGANQVIDTITAGTGISVIKSGGTVTITNTGITGSGTANRVAYFSGTNTIASSSDLIIRTNGKLGINTSPTFANGDLAIKGTLVLVDPEQSLVPIEGAIYYSSTSKKFLFSDGTSWYQFPVSLPSNVITGSGTANFVARFTGSNTIGDSVIRDDGTNVAIGGNIISNRRLAIYGDIAFGGSATYYYFYSPTNSGFVFAPGGTSQIIITSDGRFFIGGSHVSAKLYVDGNTVINGSLSANTIYQGTNQVIDTINAGTGISVTRSGGTVTISATASGVGGSGTTNRVPLWTATTTLGDSAIYQSGSKIGIGGSPTLDHLFQIHLPSTSDSGLTIYRQTNTAGSRAHLHFGFNTSTNVYRTFAGLYANLSEPNNTVPSGELFFCVLNTGSYVERAKINPNGRFEIFSDTSEGLREMYNSSSGSNIFGFYAKDSANNYVRYSYIASSIVSNSSTSRTATLDFYTVANNIEKMPLSLNDNVAEIRNIIRLVGLSSDPSSPVNGYLYYNTSSGLRLYHNNSWITLGAGGGLSGSGTANRLARWSASTTLTDSIIRDTGSYVSINGDNTNNYLLQLAPSDANALAIYRNTNTAGQQEKISFRFNDSTGTQIEYAGITATLDSNNPTSSTLTISSRRGGTSYSSIVSNGDLTTVNFYLRINPTTVSPPSSENGVIWYDNSANQFKFRQAGNWVTLGSSGGTFYTTANTFIYSVTGGRNSTTTTSNITNTTYYVPVILTISVSNPRIGFWVYTPSSATYYWGAAVYEVSPGSNSATRLGYATSSGYYTSTYLYFSVDLSGVTLTAGKIYIFAVYIGSTATRLCLATGPFPFMLSYQAESGTIYAYKASGAPSTSINLSTVVTGNTTEIPCVYIMHW